MEASPLFIRINVGYGLLPQLSDLFLTGKSLLDTYEKDKMKVLLSLSILCVTLALCQAACFRQLPQQEIKDGLWVPQDSCTDPYDGSKHLSGSQWNTEHCISCSCSGGEMECCTRYGGIAVGPEGCRAVVNPETCEYEFYKTANPLEPCF